MYEPRKAAFFMYDMACETGLPWPEKDSQAMADVLAATDNELSADINRYNTRASTEQRIDVSIDFLNGLRRDAAKLLEKRNGL